MAKINRKNAVENIIRMLDGRKEMTEAEFKSFTEEFKENCISDLKKYVEGKIVSTDDGKLGIIGTSKNPYWSVNIIEKAAEKKAKAPRVREVQNYTNKKGKTYNASNMISTTRGMEMTNKGYSTEYVEDNESAQEAYDRLSASYEVVRVYSMTTEVRGKYQLYAMCR